MNNLEYAKSYVEEAERRIRVAEEAIKEDAYAKCNCFGFHIGL